MSSTLVIQAADSSGRWYLLPGSLNSYELKIANESDHSVLCKLSLDEPAGAGTVTPSSLTLKAGESRSVSIAFKPDWLTLRDRKAIVTARDAAGTVLATFVHDLVAATTTDCSVSLAWKEEIAGDGMLRGFVLTCAIRSISSTPGIFEPEFVEHPSLRFPEKQRITLGPGEASTFDVPIVWNRSARDNEGWNHPRTIEVGVAVTHGRRSASAPWDLVQQHIEPYLTDSDRAPVVARRPPPPQFTQPGGAGAPAVSPLAVTTPQEPVLAAAATETPAARIERAEMETGVASGGPRFPVPPAPPAPRPASERETIAVAPGTLLLIALAIGAIAIVFVWMLRSPINTTAVSTGPIPVASPALPSTHFVTRPSAKPQPKKSPGRPSAAPSESNVTTSAGAAAATGASSTQAPAAPNNPSTSAPRSRRAAAVPARVSPIDRSALVQLNGVNAEYLRGGRQVRVTWDSYAQARAHVQVLDARNVIVAETTVGRRMGALLALPRGYRGSVYVQVTAIGYDGERVVNSTSLGPP
jgi:hypothetical protein